MNPLPLGLTALALSLLLGAPGLAQALAPHGADSRPAPVPLPRPGEATATFAGGCFWCLETAFEGVPGIRSATAGYCGGAELHPTYEAVGSGLTGHSESVQVIFDPKVIPFAQVLERYWHNSDPFSAEGQFCDRGHQYRPAIFYHDEAQRRLAGQRKKGIETRFKQRVVTEIVPYREFWAAELYHQDFYKKDPERYHSYREGCGRDRRLREIWGKDAGKPSGAAGAAGATPGP
jgi:peptide-methionine (S)-S-oxide reductase